MALAASTKGKATKAARSDWMEWIARFGLATRGLLYLVVAVLALQLAVGDHGERADREGALQAVARQPMGRALLVVVAVGLAAYALWRLTEGVVNPQQRDDDAKGWTMRAAEIGRAAIYITGVFTAVRILRGAPGGGNNEVDWTARVLSWPFGVWLVGIVGAALIGVGVWNVFRGVSGKFRKKLDVAEMGPIGERWACRIAIAGLVGRGLVFGLVGSFLIRAAVRYDPNSGVGLDGALKAVADKAYGPYALVVFAVALLMFAGFSFIEARYRDVLEPS